MSTSEQAVHIERQVVDTLDQLTEARERTIALVEDLDDAELMGPRLSIINPPRWEIGHVAFFQEFWCLRHFRDERPLLPNGDELYDSARVAHDTRWDLPLPSRTDTLEFMKRVLDRVIETNQTADDKKIDDYGQKYFLKLALFHEQMHAEALAYTRQTLSYKAPGFSAAKLISEPARTPRCEGDARVPGGKLMLGGNDKVDFVFDNELSAHQVEVAGFDISRVAVTEGQFAAFVDDRGYLDRRHWSEDGWTWREKEDARHPLYWTRDSNGVWQRRRFNEWRPIQDRVAMIHVNYYEADAYCRWAGRRLPTEAEWEMAAGCEPATDSLGMLRKRTYPWGEQEPTGLQANLDFSLGGPIEVDLLPDGDSAFGCRQMIGNTWEWTSSDFKGFPNFKPGPYKEYSEPWFGDHKVLKGGCWATRSSMIRNAYRNFYKPDRRDVWAGFRTCAL